MKRLVLLLLVLVFAVAGCSTSAGAATVSPSQFQDVVEQPQTIVVDVRTPAEFAEGHLANAVNIDVESAGFAAAVSKLDPNATYAVYCRSGNRSQGAVQQMEEAGLTDVSELDGGIVAWQEQGLPVVR
jgi:rhodanese-related sulfurtransferase